MGLLGQVTAETDSVKQSQAGQQSGGAQIKYVEDMVYGSSFAAKEMPKYEMAEESIPAQTAYRLIKDELDLDGSPSLNLASFVSTYMEPEAEKLMMENISKNYIDVEEYQACADIQNRCVAMIGNMFHATQSEEPLGVSTVGSSEAIILATLAMKRRWQDARKAAGKDWSKPNMVMSAAVQVCWEKATRYLEIEEKYVYCTPDRYVIDPKEAIALCDENTIGLVSILGVTYTGEYEDTKELSRQLDQLQKEKGLDIKIHVDAASGGFVVPFVDPELEWDFRLPRVVSINTSGHKYGQVVAGVGWALWRSKEYLPEPLIFHVSYLGADQASFTLNFSKSAVQIIGQYYVLVRNGKAGFRAIMQSITQTADFFADALESSGRFAIMTPGHGKSLPVVAFRLKDKKHYDEFAIAASLRERGWIIPAYTMAPKAETLKLLRVVCRQDFSRSRCEDLIRDINSVCEHLESLDKVHVDAMMESHKKHKSAKKHKLNGAKYHKDHSLGGKDEKTNPAC